MQFPRSLLTLNVLLISSYRMRRITAIHPAEKIIVFQNVNEQPFDDEL